MERFILFFSGLHFQSSNFESLFRWLKLVLLPLALYSLARNFWEETGSTDGARQVCAIHWKFSPWFKHWFERNSCNCLAKQSFKQQRCSSLHCTALPKSTRAKRIWKYSFIRNEHREPHRTQVKIWLQYLLEQKRDYYAKSSSFMLHLMNSSSQ